MSLFGKIYRKVKPQKNHLDLLVKNGNLKVGKNSDISGLYVEILHEKKDAVNIEIGDDCLLMGSISIYSENAKVKISDRVFIGPNSKLICCDQIELEDDIMISWNCTLIDTNSHSLKSDERKFDVINWKKGWMYKDWSVVDNKRILIKKKSWVGFNSIVMKGVLLEEGTVVAAGSVVTRDSEPYSIIGGNPAVFIKKTT